MLALLVPLSFGAHAGWPTWCWPVLASGAGLIAWFRAHGRRPSREGRTPLIDPAMFGPGATGLPLAGIFALMACYGGLLFTLTLYLQGALHRTPLYSGLTFAAYAAGFATASLTWARLPIAAHRSVPSAGFALMAAATAALAAATRGSWPLYATMLLPIAGAGHAAGFGALVRRATADLAPRHAPSLSGVVATINQLAVAVGIAAGGTLYFSLARVTARGHVLTPVLLALAATEALFGAMITAALARARRASGPDPAESLSGP